MKAYTDIEQSKKLVELGIDVNTADMYWDDWKRMTKLISFPKVAGVIRIKDLHCWSLAALFDLLPTIKNYIPTLRRLSDGGYSCVYRHKTDNSDWIWYNADNPVDACVDMILKLNKENLL